MDTVNTDSWKDRGGSVGALRELEGQLIVTQIPENHRQLVNLLDQLREERNNQITVEARFISCDEQLLDDLFAKWKKPRPTSKRPAGPSPTTARPAGSGEPPEILTDAFLADDQVTDFMLAIQKSADSAILTSPRLTLFNGQRAYVKVSTQKSYLSEYTATQKPGGETRF